MVLGTGTRGSVGMRRTGVFVSLSFIYCRAAFAVQVSLIWGPRGACHVFVLASAVRDTCGSLRLSCLGVSRF